MLIKDYPISNIKLLITTFSYNILIYLVKSLFNALIIFLVAIIFKCYFLKGFLPLFL